MVIDYDPTRPFFAATTEGRVVDNCRKVVTIRLPTKNNLHRREAALHLQPIIKTVRIRQRNNPPQKSVPEIGKGPIIPPPQFLVVLVEQ